MKLIKFSIALVLSVTLFVSGSCSDSYNEAVVDSIKGENFKEYLLNKQFIIQEGELTKVDLFQLVDAGIFPNCIGNNADAPYMTCRLPPAPGQQITDPFTEPSGRSMEYHLRPDEAIVFILNTPPEAMYYSYQSFLAAIVDNGTRKRIFVPLGDTYNKDRIATSSTPYGNGTNPFGSKTIIIVTADKNIDTEMRNAAKAAGYSEAIINTEVVPSGKLNLGTDPDKDTFHFLHRLNHFKDEAAGRSYLEKSPGVVWRVTPSKPIISNPFPAPVLKQRGTGNTEKNLSASLNELGAAIKSKYSNLNAKELSTDLWFKIEDSDNIQRKTNVLGITRDALYLSTEDFLLSDREGEFIIVYGINHTQTGKSSFNNAVIYGRRLLNGVASVYHYKLQGSADEYLPNHPDKDKMYAWKFTRSLTDTHNATPVPYNNKSRGIELTDSAFVLFRLYVEPQTKIGPAPNEILYDRIIKFEPKD